MVSARMVAVKALNEMPSAHRAGDGDGVGDAERRVPLDDPVDDDQEDDGPRQGDGEAHQRRLEDEVGDGLKDDRVPRRHGVASGGRKSSYSTTASSA